MPFRQERGNVSNETECATKIFHKFCMARPFGPKQTNATAMGNGPLESRMPLNCLNQFPCFVADFGQVRVFVAGGPVAQRAGHHGGVAAAIEF